MDGSHREPGVVEVIDALTECYLEEEKSRETVDNNMAITIHQVQGRDAEVR